MAHDDSIFPVVVIGAGLAGLSAGVHTVEVIDANGCTNTVDITITEPALLVISEDLPILKVLSVSIRAIGTFIDFTSYFLKYSTSSISPRF